jgi:hypothetical protein
MITFERKNILMAWERTAKKGIGKNITLIFYKQNKKFFKFILLTKSDYIYKLSN